MKFDYGSVAKIDAKEMGELKFDVKSFEKGLQIENPYDFWTVAEKEQFAYITEKLNDEKNLEVFKTWLLVDYVDRYNKFLSDKYKYLKATYGVDTENPDMQARQR